MIVDIACHTCVHRIVITWFTVIVQKFAADKH